MVSPEPSAANPTQEDELVRGAVVAGRYRLLREIARGNVCRVAEAQHTFTQRTVALKLLMPRSRSDTLARGRLVREAHALVQVNHPGVVEVLDGGDCPEFGPFIALEMLSGRPLDGLLTAQRRLSAAETVRIGVEIAETLCYFHAHGVIHRDLKPANIFLAQDTSGARRVRLLDLGIAALSSAPADVKLTGPDEPLGTAEYMAPEQLMAQPCDHRADLYAFGVTLYECMTGDVPYSGTYPEVLVKVMSGDPPRRVNQLVQDVPDALARLVATLLEREPEKRPQSSEDVMRMLRAVQGTLPASKLPAGPPAALRRPEPMKIPGGTPVAETPVSAPKPQFDDPSQRRQFARVPYVSQIRIIYADGMALDGRSEDVSEGGLLAVTDRRCRDNEQAELRFALPLDGRVAKIPVETRWVNTSRGMAATGLRFLSLTDAQRMAIQQYVELMNAPKPGK
jgi:serine/threonine protein kinase